MLKVWETPVEERGIEYFNATLGEEFVSRCIKAKIDFNTLQEFIYCCDCLSSLMENKYKPVSSNTFLLTTEWTVNRYGTLLVKIHNQLSRVIGKKVNPLEVNFSLDGVEHQCSFMREKKRHQVSTLTFTNVRDGKRINTLMLD